MKCASNRAIVRLSNHPITLSSVPLIEEICVSFLREHGIFDKEVMHCNRKPNSENQCGEKMKQKTFKNRKGEAIHAFSSDSFIVNDANWP